MTKHKYTSPSATVATVRKRYGFGVNAVCFNNKRQGAPDTRIWTQEFDHAYDSLLAAVKYAVGDVTPRYFTVDYNPHNKEIGYLNIYF
jgi:hypothetical protein